MDNKLKAIIFGALVMTTISFVPLVNLICCMGILLGGYAAVSSYGKKQTDPDYRIKNKDGILLGLFSGLLAAVIVTGINLLLSLLSKENPFTDMMPQIEKYINTIPPELKNQFQKLTDEFDKFGFSPTLTIITLISNLIIYPLFGAIGGLFGVILNKKNKNKKITL